MRIPKETSDPTLATEIIKSFPCIIGVVFCTNFLHLKKVQAIAKDCGVEATVYVRKHIKKTRVFMLAKRPASFSLWLGD